MREGDNLKAKSEVSNSTLPQSAVSFFSPWVLLPSSQRREERWNWSTVMAYSGCQAEKISSRWENIISSWLESNSNKKIPNIKVGHANYTNAVLGQDPRLTNSVRL